jgi:hypothetical protein
MFYKTTLVTITLVVGTFTHLIFDEKPDKPLQGTSSMIYRFDYRSEKNAGQVTYKVRNQSKGIFTPVQWKDEKETALEANIPRCKSDDPCSWIEVTKNYLKIAAGNTTLSYGRNKDECSEKVRAYRKSRDAEEEEEREDKDTLRTRFKGTIADKNEKSYYVDVEVSSQRKAKNIVYILKNQMKDDLLIFRTKPEKDESGKLTIRWKAAAGKSFLVKLMKDKIVKINASGELKIELQADVVVVEEDLLEIYAGDERIASTTAPAFRPKEDKSKEE